ncbi:hypothetical protein Catovirus_1_636 [Catovirus CTV1]|uniref:Uncharacterized protein n=1 Tax=Catovirus CTV1 TaxID=1977631 RepID=A0A1V0SA48_9VIRU|nr:hypothetical protein Catovirus_1_636 [Catovirus CTV1]
MNKNIIFKTADNECISVSLTEDHPIYNSEYINTSIDLNHDNNKETIVCVPFTSIEIKNYINYNQPSIKLNRLNFDLPLINLNHVNMAPIMKIMLFFGDTRLDEKKCELLIRNIVSFGDYYCHKDVISLLFVHYKDFFYNELMGAGKVYLNDRIISTNNIVNFSYADYVNQPFLHDIVKVSNLDVSCGYYVDDSKYVFTAQFYCSGYNYNSTHIRNSNSNVFLIKSFDYCDKIGLSMRCGQGFEITEIRICEYSNVELTPDNMDYICNYQKLPIGAIHNLHYPKYERYDTDTYTYYNVEYNTKTLFSIVITLN